MFSSNSRDGFVYFLTFIGEKCTKLDDQWSIKNQLQTKKKLVCPQGVLYKAVRYLYLPLLAKSSSQILSSVEPRTDIPSGNQAENQGKLLWSIRSWAPSQVLCLPILEQKQTNKKVIAMDKKPLMGEKKRIIFLTF